MMPLQKGEVEGCEGQGEPITGGPMEGIDIMGVVLR